MAQIFDRGLVLALKVGALVCLALIVALILVWRWSIDDPHAMNSPPHQPLPFSHEHHVRDDGIDCRYCHRAVEESSFAGLPSTQVCMTCHSQLFRDVALFTPLHASFRSNTRLQWTRVNDLPDFVFFNHSAHVTHGVPCKECHGRIDHMPLTARVRSLDMQWCLSCHRDPTEHLVKANQVFDMNAQPPASKLEREALRVHYGILGSQSLTECSTCHR